MKLIKIFCLTVLLVFTAAGCVTGNADIETEPETQEITEPETQELTEPETEEETSARKIEEGMPFADLRAEDVEKVEFYYSTPNPEGPTAMPGSYIYECTSKEIERYIGILNSLSVSPKYVPEMDGCPEWIDPQPAASLVYINDGSTHPICAFVYEEYYPRLGTNELYIDGELVEPNPEFIDEIVEFDLYIREVISAQGIDLY